MFLGGNLPKTAKDKKILRGVAKLADSDYKLDLAFYKLLEKKQ